jgi:hypothetical protein
VSVKNRLINRFKDITKSVRSPCPRCPFYNPESVSKCDKFGEDKYHCNKWRNYQLSIESRNSLLNATEPQFERSSHHSSLNKIIGRELKDIILQKLDKAFHNDLDKLMSGGKLSKQRIRRLKKEMLNILETLSPPTAK